MHLWELHWPIVVPEEFQDDEYGPLRYIKRLSSMDQTLNSLIQCLPEDTCVILCGDHGESIFGSFDPTGYIQQKIKNLRDKIKYEKQIDTRTLERLINILYDKVRNPKLPDHYIENEHGEVVYDFNTNVPLAINHPKYDSLTINEQCRQVDILPTVLDIFNFNSQSTFDGKSLFPPKSVESRDAYMRACGGSLRGKQNWKRSIRTAENNKYIEYQYKDWEPELYDLTDDPKELHPIPDPEMKEKLAGKLPSQTLSEVDKLEIQDLLEDLGYRTQ